MSEVQQKETFDQYFERLKAHAEAQGREINTDPEAWKDDYESGLEPEAIFGELPAKD